MPPFGATALTPPSPFQFMSSKRLVANLRIIIRQDKRHKLIINLVSLKRVQPALLCQNRLRAAIVGNMFGKVYPDQLRLATLLDAYTKILWLEYEFKHSIFPNFIIQLYDLFDNASQHCNRIIIQRPDVLVRC